jgi:hypothetical protein
MLWIYAKNDHFINEELAMGLYQEFTKAGGRATLIAAPAFGDEGHSLFTAPGIPTWTPYVDDFLKTQGLVLRSQMLLVSAPAHVQTPVGLSPSGQKAFGVYLASPDEKAFAAGPNGSWGYEFGRRTINEAKEAALHLCQKQRTQTCRILMVNDKASH